MHCLLPMHFHEPLVLPRIVRDVVELYNQITLKEVTRHYFFYDIGGKKIVRVTVKHPQKSLGPVTSYQYPRQLGKVSMEQKHSIIYETQFSKPGTWLALPFVGFTNSLPEKAVRWFPLGLVLSVTDIPTELFH